MAAPTTLYRFFDAENVLLYVGIAAGGAQRWQDHARKEWWTRVARVETTHFPDRESALTAEREAIQAEHPSFNVMHNVPRTPPLGVYRSHGTGSICQRTDGRWQVAFTESRRRRYWTVRDRAGAELILAVLNNREASADARQKAIDILIAGVELQRTA